MSKELNPSPKIPEGDAEEKVVEQVLGVSYGELSPNPNLKEGYVKGEHGVGEPTNPNNEPKKQVVTQGLTVDDVLKLIKANVHHGFDVDHLPEDIVKYDNLVTDIDEAIAKGVIPRAGTYSDLTQTQIEGITAIIKKAIKVGAITDLYQCEVLTYFYKHDAFNAFSACFGCYSNEEFAGHTEIALSDNNLIIKILEV